MHGEGASPSRVFLQLQLTTSQTTAIFKIIILVAPANNTE